jgi:hypothetical protein
MPRDPTVLDEGTRLQVQTFIDVLGARIVGVIPRDEMDPRVAGGTTWKEWHRHRLRHVFADGWRTRQQVAAEVAQEKQERAELAAQWRNVARGWSKWMAWWTRSLTA